MKNLIAISLAFFILTGCKTTESIKYVDRKVVIPKVIIEYCGVDTIKKCGKIINNNKDLIECYLHNESKIDEANAMIKLCKKKMEKVEKEIKKRKEEEEDK